MFDEEPPAGAPDWVVSFGDMMSLLLTFFILLFSMSEVKSDRKFQAMADSFRRQFGYSMSRRTLTPGHSIPLNSNSPRTGSEEHSVQENLENARQKEKTKGRDRERLWITRPGTSPAAGIMLLFPEHSAELSDENRKQLEAARTLLEGKTNRIEIRGHATGQSSQTGDKPSSEWDLAFERARATMRFLVEDEGIDPRRIRLSVAGKNEPVNASNDPLELARNSRVEVFLVAERVPPLGTPSLESSDSAGKRGGKPEPGAAPEAAPAAEPAPAAAQ